ncbi:MAG: hypothetical protein JXR83_15860, partial [Deltaproteobacteria bacterium]|nr:hypothetical protein [Deltaproteobacteria bacterium]
MKTTPAAIRLFAAAALALATACQCEPDPVAPKPEPGQPLTVEELCRVYLSRIANSDLFYDPLLCYQRTLARGTDYTAAELARRCRPGSEARKWVDELYRDLRAGRVKMDWRRARECLDRSRELRRDNPGYRLIDDPEWNALRTGACVDFVHGTVPDMSPCKLDWECRDGRGCYAVYEFDEDHRVCGLPGVDNENCGDYRPCADGYWCNELWMCQPRAADGEACDPDHWGIDCMSGSCGGDGLCDPTPVLKALGEPCTIDVDGTDDCDNASYCVNCRPAFAGGANACRILGGSGAYCRDWYDCVLDLGCRDHVCSAEPAGATCAAGAGTASQLLCEEGLRCVPLVASCVQHAYEQQCNLQAPRCGWNNETGNCELGEGRCFFPEELPLSGPCLNGGYCGDGAWCRPADRTCQPLAGENEACSPDSSAGAPCASGLVCSDDVCREACGYDEDCPDGSFCGQDAVCRPLTPGACSDSEQCPSDFYCAVPPDPCAGQEEHICAKLEQCQISPLSWCKPVLDCLDLSSIACNTHSECFYYQGYGCLNHCAEHDQHEGRCRADPECAWWAESTVCDSRCYAIGDDEAACRDDALCSVVVSRVCALRAPIGRCERRLAVGEPCTAHDQCLSGNCATNAYSGNTQCAVATSGCDRNLGFIRSAFLLGLVFLGARGLRR